MTSPELKKLIESACIDPFRALWNEIRDYYAPTMSAPEATKKAMAAMSGIGFEVYPLTRTMFLVDDKPFEIKKVRGRVHFDLIQHDVRIREENPPPDPFPFRLSVL